MKDIKKRVELYSLWDHTGLEAHLSRMAEKGWLIEKIGNFFWVYRRIEPKKITFCVTYYPKATVFTPEPSEDQETFYEFCQYAGWELAASCAQLQIFRNERENPTPIETDPVLELDTIHRTVKRSSLLSQALLMLLSLAQGGLLVSGFLRDPIGILSSASAFVSGMCWVLVMLLTGSEIIAYYRWRARAKKAAERGEFLATNSRIKLQIGSLIAVGIVLLYYILSVFTSGDPVLMTVMPLTFLGLGLMIFLVHALRDLLKRKKVPAGVNLAVTLIACFVLSFVLIGGLTFGTLAGILKGWFAGNRETYQYRGSAFTVYADQLPLTVEDLTGREYEANAYVRERRDTSSLLLAQYTMRQTPRFDVNGFTELPMLRYTITLVKVPALYGMCKNALLAEYDGGNGGEHYWDNRAYALQDPAPWGAEEVYRVMDEEYGPWDIYLLCYPDRFVEFFPEGELTPEQMTLVGEKLGTN